MFDWFRNKDVAKGSVGLVSGDTGVKTPTKERYIERSFSDPDAFYRYLAKDIAIIGAIIAAWRFVTVTKSGFQYVGKPGDIKDAEEVIAELDDRLYSEVGTKEGGIGKLTTSFVNEVFTVGRFGYEAIPKRDGSGIDFIRQYNTYTEIRWEEFRGTKLPFILIDADDDRWRRPSPHFFYNAFNWSFKDPAGHSLLHSVEWIARIEEQLLLDMAVSSHNIGNPRMHMKIGMPEPLPSESGDKYKARIESFFKTTVDNFGSIEVDQNFFTWDSVEIDVVGANQGRVTPVFDINFRIVVEEIIVAMLLYPSVMGYSNDATKNWVEVQQNVLITKVGHLQGVASIIADHIGNLELKLKGIPVRAKWGFEPIKDPNIHKQRQAEGQHFLTVNQKVVAGYISKDDGARELGYNEAHNQDVVSVTPEPAGDKDKHGEKDKGLADGSASLTTGNGKIKVQG